MRPCSACLSTLSFALPCWLQSKRAAKKKELHLKVAAADPAV